MAETKRSQIAKPDTATPKSQDMTPQVTEGNEAVPQLLLSRIFRSLDHPSARDLTPGAVKQLQRQHGNAFVSRLLQRAHSSPQASSAHVMRHTKRSGKGQPHLSRQTLKPHLRRSIGQRRSRAIQRNYAALSPMGKAQVDQKADQLYAEKTQQFEFLMGPFISKDPRVHGVVDTMLARVKKIVDAWAKSVGKSQAEVYGREFGYQTADAYYGAFEMTAANITQIFSDTSQPLRSKLKVIYNAVRNNNLAKYLKVAATQLQQTAKGKTPQSVKIRSAAGSAKQNGKIIKGQTEKETVDGSFAADSGLGDWLSDDQIMDFAKAHKDEKKTAGGFSKRGVFGHDMFSRIFNWSKNTSDANASRRGGNNSGINLSEQRTLNASDVTDLTDAEIKFMYKRKNLPEPDAVEMTRFRTDPTSKLAWEQGGEYYDVIPSSDVHREASEVKARLEAGISGSTDLMLHAMQNLGMAGDRDMMKTMRLALAGWMLSNRDHSFYEIYKAGESYGIPFEIDKNQIGKEYESDANMFPMRASEFKDLLPEKKFPAYFLSTAYKNTLANALPAPAKEADDFKKELAQEGIDPESIRTFDQRDLAALSALSKAAMAEQFPAATAPFIKKYQPIRRLREHTGYMHLALKNAALAEQLLMVLVRKHHGGSGKLPVFSMAENADAGTKTNYYKDILTDAGIARVLLETLTLKDLQLLFELRGRVTQAQKTPPTNQLNRTQINQFVAANCMRTGSQKLKGYIPVFVATLIQTYHGDSVLHENEKMWADSSRQMSGHQEEAAKKLTDDQLNNLSHPNKPGVTADNYWASTAARQQFQKNQAVVIQSYLKEINKNAGEKDRVLRYFREVKFAANPLMLSDFNETLRTEGFMDTISAFAEEDDITNHILPPHARDAYLGAKGLHDKELGSIFQYTGSLYKPLVNSANSFSVADFRQADLNSHDWGSPLATLQYTGPMLKAISSGLAKLPVYPGKAYRLSESGSQLGQIANDRARLRAALKKFRIGSVETANYPKSSARTLSSQFISTNYNLPKFDVVYEINNIKSGRNIEFFSDKPNEQEILFPPGSSMRITEILDHNPDNPADKHIWIRMTEI